MQNRFLQQIASDILGINTLQALNTTIILPSKRACLELKREVAQSGTTTILPTIQSIEEFVSTYIEKNIPSELMLIGTLYHVYGALSPSSESFDQFYPWGKLLLNDFDEIDKYLVQPTHIFSYIEAQKRIDETYELSEEKIAVLAKFFGSINESNAPIKEKFLKIWELLLPIYVEFNHRLAKNNYIYTGKLYREFYDKIIKEDKIFSSKNLWFCGFSALTLVEEEIIQAIIDQADVTLYWDADDLYMNDNQHEAGNFMRSYLSKFIKAKNIWIQKENFQNKNFCFAHASSNTLQILYAINEIKNIPPHESVAVVLSDEKLLTLAMQHLGKDTWNITMGSKIAESNCIQLLGLYFEYFSTKKDNNIHVNTLIQLMSHPIFLDNKILDKKVLLHFKETAKANNWQYLSLDFITEFFKNKNVFNQLGLYPSSFSFINQMEEVFGFIYTTEINHTTKTYLSYLIQRLNQIKNEMEILQLDLPLSNLQKLLNLVLSAVSASFDTDSTSKRQIMGFLETRLLDFDHLYILSANEGILPHKSQQYSFIPFNIKRVYGLPTQQEYDAIYAYHFYRLLQRAKEIHLVYLKGGIQDSSERSRYILQIEEELASKNKIEYRNIVPLADLQMKPQWTPTFIVKKQDHVQKMLAMKHSPTSLQCYAKSEVEFFYKYIVGIKEPETLIEYTDDAWLGKILHRSIELIYKPLLGKILTSKDFETIMHKEYIFAILQQAYKEEKLNWEIKTIYGKNALDRDILLHLIANVLKADKELAKNQTLIIDSLEITLHRDVVLDNGNIIHLKGKLDRIDTIINERGRKNNSDCRL